MRELFDDTQRRCSQDSGLDHLETVKGGHGREETRRCWMLPASPNLDDHGWPGLHSVEDHYVLSTLPVDAQHALRGVRQHWKVENKLHWVLDVAYGEDAHRSAKDHGPENLGVLRRWALNLLRRDPSPGGIARKRKRAAWNDDFRVALLQPLLPPPT